MGLWQNIEQHIMASMVEKHWIIVFKQIDYLFFHAPADLRPHITMLLHRIGVVYIANAHPITQGIALRFLYWPAMVLQGQTFRMPIDM